MIRILVLLTLASVCVSYDLSLHLAEKLAVPHYSRHGYDYPQINFGRPQGNAAPAVSQSLPARPSSLSGPSSFSQPSSVNRPSSFSQSGDFGQPSSVNRPSSFSQSGDFGQPSTFRRPSGGQTRFFNMYAPNLASELRSRFRR
ncbi:RNA-binding protein EWS-like [Parasteatoda tepidariorum]|uniref:RNA-binding protein EWS-like n=1 Tax=Parasteatoda tepidariorum TaxID=114398 RepID=UPI00077FAF3B